MSSESSGSWHPLLEGELAQRAVRTVRALAATWAERRVDDSSLGSGSAGLALCFAYLAEAFDDPEYGAAAERFLGHAAQALARRRLPPSLFGGVAGVGWVIDHLQTKFFPGDDQDDANEAIDEMLITSLSHSWLRRRDLTAGLAGAGVYGLERRRRPSGLRVIEAVVARLDEWGAVVAAQPPGVAHGLAGLMPVLASACAAGVCVTASQRLLGEVAGALGAASGSGWADGEPAVALALYAAAAAVGAPAWSDDAIARARAAAVRDLGVSGASLGTGAAGVAHIYNRFYQSTGEPAFGVVARRWFERLLAMPAPDEPGLLSGAAGVGLALLAAVGEIEPAWDRALGMSLA